MNNECVIPDGFNSLGNGIIENRTRHDKLRWFPVKDIQENLKALLPREVQEKEFGIPFLGEPFTLREYHHEEAEEEKLVNSIRKWGGVYLPVYSLSKGEDGLPSSVPNQAVWTDVSFKEASEVAVRYGKKHLKGKIIDTGILPGWLFDLVCMHEISQGNRTWEDVAEIQLSNEPKSQSLLEYEWLDTKIRLWTREKFGSCRVIRVRNYPMTPKSKYRAALVSRNPMFTDERNSMLSFQMYVALK